jgi:SAM-dependent methyltransferase
MEAKMIVHRRDGLDGYRQSHAERQRETSLLAMIPPGATLLDVGARDGHYSRLLAGRFERVTALDLVRPEIAHPSVECVAGDVTCLQFPDSAFDCVLCAEVLEHIPPLEAACRELSRVAARSIVIGVPYRQDTRIGRTNCHRCGKISPPWGHFNRFDEARLAALFPDFHAAETQFVGRQRESTNPLATWLMDRGGNPWGTYSHGSCSYCGEPIAPPAARSFVQKLCSKGAIVMNDIHASVNRPWANWIHIRFERR